MTACMIACPCIIRTAAFARRARCFRSAAPASSVKDFSERILAGDRRAEMHDVHLYGRALPLSARNTASPADTAHKIRICFGNGLRPEIWIPFRDRFHLDHILEFYAATEGNASMFNFDFEARRGRPHPEMDGAAFRRESDPLRYRRPAADPRPGWICIRMQAWRGRRDFGEHINDPAQPANRFEGYADPAATERKILRDVFAEGDAWFRSGDLMKRDKHGYFYFIDRIGDTFRWKGDNVSTTEVAEAVGVFPGVREAAVYGVSVPGHDGRAGMMVVCLEPDADFDLDRFRQHLVDHLPDYARPLFLRFRDGLDVTTTFNSSPPATGRGRLRPVEGRGSALCPRPRRGHLRAARRGAPSEHRGKSLASLTWFRLPFPGTDLEACQYKAGRARPCAIPAHSDPVIVHLPGELRHGGQIASLFGQPPRRSAPRLAKARAFRPRPLPRKGSLKARLPMPRLPSASSPPRRPCSASRARSTA